MTPGRASPGGVPEAPRELTLTLHTLLTVLFLWLFHSQKRRGGGVSALQGDTKEHDTSKKSIVELKDCYGLRGFGMRAKVLHTQQL